MSGRTLGILLHVVAIVPLGISPAAAERAADLAEADSLAVVIERRTDDWLFVDALASAVRQLDLRVLHLGYRHPQVAATHQAIARIFHLSGKRASALAQLEYTLELRCEVCGPRHPDVAETLIWLARCRKNILGREDMALLLAPLDEAESILRESEPEDGLPFAEYWQARGNVEGTERAVRLYRRALAIRARHLGADHRDVSETKVWLAHRLLWSGRPEEAERIVREAMGALVSRGHGSDGALITARKFLGGRLFDRGETDSALVLLRQAAREIEDRRAQRPIGFGLLRIQAAGILPEVLLELGRREEAWEEQARNLVWVSDSFASMSRRSVLDERTRSRLAELGARSLQLHRQCDQGTRNGRIPDRQHHELLRVESERQLIERELFVRSVRSASGGEAGPVLARVQRALDPDQAVVGWMLEPWRTWNRRSEHRAWAWVVRHEGPVRWIRLGTFDDREAWKAFWRLPRRGRDALVAASEWPRRVALDAEIEAVGTECRERYFDPLLPELDGVRQIVVAGPPPGRMPIEWLADRKGARAVDGFAISYVSSPERLARLREERRAAAEHTRRALVMGDPWYSPDDARMVGDEAPMFTASALSEAGSASRSQIEVARRALGGDTEALAKLPRLPYSRHEVERVAALLPNPLLLVGDAASEKSLNELRDGGGLREFDVVHIAAHALIDPLLPLRSCLALSRPRRGVDRAQDMPSAPDGLVTAREILLGWDLDADLVTLSGCRTGGRYGKYSELVGFRQTLLRAGARSLLVSVWDVDDAATALLMERFYGNLAGGDSGRGPAGAGMSKTEALAEAKRWLRGWEDEEGGRPFEHPAYWAGFVLYGDPE